MEGSDGTSRLEPRHRSAGPKYTDPSGTTSCTTTPEQLRRIELLDGDATPGYGGRPGRFDQWNRPPRRCANVTADKAPRGGPWVRWRTR